MAHSAGCSAPPRPRTTPRRSRSGREEWVSWGEELQFTNRGLHRRERRLSEPADRRIAHHLRHIVDEGELRRARSDGAPGRQPVERLVLPYGAETARHALSARLIAEEARDPEHDIAEIDA